MSADRAVVDPSATEFAALHAQLDRLAVQSELMVRQTEPLARQNELLARQNELLAQQNEVLAGRLEAMARQVDLVAAESGRSQQRWEAADEFVRDATPLVRQAVAGATAKLDDLQGRGYGEVLGAGAKVVDRIMRTFDRQGVTSIGDNIVLLLKTIQNMR